MVWNAAFHNFVSLQIYTEKLLYVFNRILKRRPFEVLEMDMLKIYLLTDSNEKDQQNARLCFIYDQTKIIIVILHVQYVKPTPLAICPGYIECVLYVCVHECVHVCACFARTLD